MKSLPVLLALAISLGLAPAAAPLPRLKVSDNKRFLVTADGKPFFYLVEMLDSVLDDKMNLLRDVSGL